VGEHHDGFAMYDCSRTRWNAVKMGPRRDVVGELAEAVRAAGLKFGVSSHRAYHWFYYTYDEDFDTTDPANAGLYGSPHPPDAPPDEAFLEDWYARTKEIVDKYQPDLMWFDFGISRPVFEPYRRRFAAYYYQKASDWGRPVVLNYKGDAFAESAAVLDIERGRLDALRALPWQTDTSVCRRSWGYIQNPDYKEAGEIIDLLVDVVSKNGCLLLNVGPRPDGTIPELQQMLLRRIGGWLKINGEAIHGTRPFRIYGEGPTKIASGRMGEKENRQRYTAADIRFTRRPHVIYAICLDWPGQTATIRSLGHKTGFMDRRIAQVNLLGHRIPLRWVRRTDRLTVEMPARPPCEAAYVLKIILKRS
jgi:alpha-L-fucosidase